MRKFLVEKTRETAKPSHYTPVLIALGVVIIISMSLFVLIPAISALTGYFSTTSPFSCGANCSGGYELSGHDENYCYNNPIDCYNTIDECRDGSNYNYEFVNNIFVTSLNGTNFTGGHTVNVTVEFDCDGDGDEITIVYHNGTSFRAIADDTCAVSELVNKSYSFVLDDIEDNHTVRAIITYDGVEGMLCGYDYETLFTDNDDVTFFVNQGPDTEKPSVADVSPAQGTIYNQTYGLSITISANVTDNYEVNRAQALIQWDSFNYTADLSLTSGSIYTANFTNITELTRYNVTILAYDTSNNLNNTGTTYFFINSTTNITITAPTSRQVLAYESLNLRFAINSDYNTDKATYSIDGGANTTVSDKLSTGFSQADQDEAIGEPDNAYNNLSMSFKPNEDMNVEVVAISLKRNGSGTVSSQLQLRTDDIGTPSGTVLAFGNITNASVSADYALVNITLNTTVSLTANTTYWLFLAPNGSATDFYTWEASNEGLYANGNYSNNHSLDLLFVAYDKYKYNASVSGIEKGTHYLIIHANSTTQNSIKSQLILFRIDDAPPTINSMGYTPNTTVLMDPNTMINVSSNITEELTIAEALLQHKKSNESEFTNTTMQSSGSIYTANFTPDSESNWSFRIYARDNSNNSAYSNNITINVSYEYSWNSTPSSFNTTSAFLNTNTTVGNITINNTADFEFTFNISKTPSTVPSIYFNSTEGNIIFNLSSGSTTTIQVTATGQSIESEQAVGIKIDPSQSNAAPDYSFANFTLVSYVSGSYLSVSITEYDSTVIQGQSRITLTASIINVGNESASNVSAYWTLPSGWTPKTNLTTSYATLGVGQQVSFTRYIDIDADAAIGSQSIRISINYSQNRSNYNEKSVDVSSSGEEETPAPTRGGGGGGGGAIAIPKTTKLEINIPEEIEIERGGNQTITGALENTGTDDLKNLSLTLQGFPITHYKITPALLSELKVNATKPFSSYINVPEYFGSGKQKVTLVVRALADNAWKEFNKNMTLVVVTEDKAQAAECFEKASEDIKELESAGIAIARLNQKLDDAKKSYYSKDYVEANNLCKEILSNAGLAISVKERINSVSNAYSSLGKDVPELSELVKLSQEAFEREDYSLANQRAEQAELLLSLKEKEVQQTASYKLGVLRQYWKEMLVLGVILAIIGIFAYSSTSLGAVTRRIRALEEHHAVVKNKIKESQRKYFVKKVLPARLYAKEMEHHRSTIGDIEKKRHELKIKKLKIISGRTLHDLEKVRQEADEGKKELQRKYFVEKSVDKKTFKNLLLGFESIIQDIERRIALKKERNNKKN